MHTAFVLVGRNAAPTAIPASTPAELGLRLRGNASLHNVAFHQPSLHALRKSHAATNAGKLSVNFSELITALWAEHGTALPVRPNAKAQRRGRHHHDSLPAPQGYKAQLSPVGSSARLCEKSWFANGATERICTVGVQGFLLLSVDMSPGVPVGSAKVSDEDLLSANHA
jgi:hypothetical protein